MCSLVCQSQATFESVRRNTSRTPSTKCLAKRNGQDFDDVVAAGDLPTVVPFLGLVGNLLLKFRFGQMVLVAVIDDLANHLDHVDFEIARTIESAECQSFKLQL